MKENTTKVCYLKKINLWRVGIVVIRFGSRKA